MLAPWPWLGENEWKLRSLRYMARQETEYADPEVVGRVDGEQFVDDETLGLMHSLIDAHRDYDTTGDLNKDKIEKLNVRIKALEAQRAELIGSAERARHQQHSLRDSYGYRLKSTLEDPHSEIDPTYRAALLAPGLNQGSLWYPRTFAFAEQFGRRLVGFNNALKQATESQPAIGVQSYQDLSGFNLTYGMTKPRTGLIPERGRKLESTCGCGTEHYAMTSQLNMPIVESTKAAVQPDARQPFYDRSDGRRVKLTDGKPTEQIRENTTVEVKTIGLPLVTGNLYGAMHLLGWYDQQGELKELTGPDSLFSVRSIQLFAVGERAVQKALSDLNKDVGRLGTNSEIFSHMFTFVAGALGVAIKTKKTARK
jgi:hypothetical protein